MNRLHTILPALLVLSIVLAAPSAWAQEEASLLVANKSGNSLYFVESSPLRVVDSVATGEAPHEVAAAPEAGRAFVANYGGGTISVIDVADRSVVEEWPLDGYNRPHGIEVGPDEEHVYVTAEDQQAVLELDASSGEILRTFTTGKDVTHMLALTSDASSLYATSIGSGTLTRIDLETGDVVSHTPTGEGAEGVDVTPDDEEVWVTNRAEDTVSIFEPGAGKVVETLDVAGFPIRVNIAARGSRAVVSSARVGAVTIFNAETQDRLERLETGTMPIGVLIPPGGMRAFVANAGDNMVSVIDLKTLSIRNTVPVGQEPDGMAFVPSE